MDAPLLRKSTCSWWTVQINLLVGFGMLPFKSVMLPVDFDVVP